MFGVCYYPEHWPKSLWSSDAKQMSELGLTYVRIGEFAWSRLEPNPGEYNWDWLDEAIDILHQHKLKVILGTPTATPPKWLIDKFPSVLATDIETGLKRGFGSRRHYDFSSDEYLAEALRISEAMAKRYGNHPGVVGWQTDNELCCHDTTLSASVSAVKKFRQWCEGKYGDIENLNRAWGNVFWSMEYRNFGEIESPFFTATEANPAHQLAYRQFSSNRVVHWHNEMIKIIREHVNDQWVTHNFIPMPETGVDNFELAENLDFACYDNYPLGRSDLFFKDLPAEQFKQIMRTGHPDFATFYHDQTRSLSLYSGEKGPQEKSNFWIMEQQPGPVNWALHNPRPAPGMIRLWTIEAFAHGADTLCYFRWRQAPFAQEQMHAGLLRPDQSKSTCWFEAEQAIKDIQVLDIHSKNVNVAKVAIVTETRSQWVDQIERQGAGYEFTQVQMQYYSALRQLGLDVDFVSQSQDLSGYLLIVVPCLPILEPNFIDHLATLDSLKIFGPRTGSKTSEFSLPESLAPGLLQSLIDCRVLSVETLRPDCADDLSWGGNNYKSTIWREELDSTSCEVLARYEDNQPAILRQNQTIYLGTLTCDGFLKDFFKEICDEVGIETLDLPSNIRIRRRGDLVFAFNYSSKNYDLPISQRQLKVGEISLKPKCFTVWQEK